MQHNNRRFIGFQVADDTIKDLMVKEICAAVHEVDPMCLSF